MTRLYKVLNGIECCKTENCKECPYRKYSFNSVEIFACRKRLYDETAELLKYIQKTDFDFNIYLNKEV